MLTVAHTSYLINTLDVHNHLPHYSITMSNSDSPLQANSFTVNLPEFLAQLMKEVNIFILVYLSQGQEQTSHDILSSAVND